MDTEEIKRLVTAAGFVFRGSIEREWRGDAPAAPAETGEIVATRIEQVLRSTQVLRRRSRFMASRFWACVRPPSLKPNTCSG